jgi:hypothetical protein
MSNNNKCKCKVSNKVGLFQLSHFDSEHVDNFRESLGAHANLTSVNDPNGGIPAGPPLATVLATEPADENEMIFTGAWCCQFTPPPALSNGVVTTTRDRTLGDDSSADVDSLPDPDPDSSDDESSAGPPPLRPRYDESRDDESSAGSLPPLRPRYDDSSDDDSSVGSLPSLVPRSVDGSVDDDDELCSFEYSLEVDASTDDDASVWYDVMEDKEV